MGWSPRRDPLDSGGCGDPGAQERLAQGAPFSHYYRRNGARHGWQGGTKRVPVRLAKSNCGAQGIHPAWHGDLRTTPTVRGAGHHRAANCFPVYARCSAGEDFSHQSKCPSDRWREWNHQPTASKGPKVREARGGHHCGSRDCRLGHHGREFVAGGRQARRTRDTVGRACDQCGREGPIRLGGGPLSRGRRRRNGESFPIGPDRGRPHRSERIRGAEPDRGQPGQGEYCHIRDRAHRCRIGKFRSAGVPWTFRCPTGFGRNRQAHGWHYPGIGRGPLGIHGRLQPYRTCGGSRRLGAEGPPCPIGIGFRAHAPKTSVPPDKTGCERWTVGGGWQLGELDEPAGIGQIGELRHRTRRLTGRTTRPALRRCSLRSV